MTDENRLIKEIEERIKLSYPDGSRHRDLVYNFIEGEHAEKINPEELTDFLGYPQKLAFSNHRK